jgi:malate dehydrogenase (oxaloacetate-decarboxylating)
MLIGTSTQPAAFTEQLVRQMASKVERPIIMPLSNPTSKCEALPEDLIRWTEGRALVATGSPFPPFTYEGRSYRIAQANNALIFPGLGLGVAVARARRISEAMLEAAADAVAELSDASTTGAALLPPVDNLRMVSAAVGIAVALAAEKEGLAQVELSSPVQQVHQAMWRPAYPQIEVV